jgi:hypothetical protein
LRLAPAAFAGPEEAEKSSPAGPHVESEIEVRLGAHGGDWNADGADSSEAEGAATAVDVDGAEDAEGEVPEDLPDHVDEIIVRFNAMHRVVYRAVRSEIGAGAANFVRSCCTRLGADATDPVEGVLLHSDGSWDENGLKRVISRKKLDDPWSLYQRVLDSEFLSLQPHLGASRADELKQQIWEIERS